MPIPVVCGNCQTRLNAPDAAAGRKVKCPKCQTVMAVPGAADDLPPPLPPPPAAGGSPFDFGGESPPARRPSGESRSSRPAPEPEPPAPPAGGAAFDFGAAVESGTGAKGRGDRDDRPRRRDADDLPADRDDRPRRPRPRDDDDDDRPRGRRPEGGKKKFPLMLVLFLLGGVLLVCCGAPLGGWFFYVLPKAKEAAERIDRELKQAAEDAKKNANANSGGSGSLPPGWFKFEAPDKSVRAAFPTVFPDDGDLSLTTQTVTGAKSWQSKDSDGSLTCILAVVKFKANSKASDRERDLKLAAGMMNFAAKDLSTPASIGWLGNQAKEMPGKSALSPDTNVVTRWVVVGNTGYVAMVLHKNKPDAAATFFGSVEALSK